MENRKGSLTDRDGDQSTIQSKLMLHKSMRSGKNIKDIVTMNNPSLKKRILSLCEYENLGEKEENNLYANISIPTMSKD